MTNVCNSGLDDWITTDPADAEDESYRRIAPICHACGHAIMGQYVYRYYGEIYCEECFDEECLPDFKLDARDDPIYYLNE